MIGHKSTKEYIYKGRESEYKAQWAKKHLIDHKVQSRQHRLQRRIIVLQIYSNGAMCCARCKEDNIDVLSIDHIDGGGHKHRTQLGPSKDFYCWLSHNNFPDGYQILCRNCNWLKRLEDLDKQQEEIH